MKLKNYYTLLTNVLGALLFMCIAFYNKFPLVTSDSGAYIGNFYGNMLPPDRPIIYSFFIFFTSFHLSTWMVIFAQCLYLAYLLRMTIAVFFDGKLLNKISLLVFTILAVFTTLPWYSAQLMADIFTPMSFLAGFAYLFHPRLNKINKSFLLFSFFLCGIMHNSNILVNLLFSVALWSLAYLGFIKGIKSKSRNLIAVCIFSIVLFLTAHLIGGYGLTMSRAGHVFLVGKMCENGVLEKYLEDNCTESPSSLCVYKGSAPAHAWDFVWNSNSPHMKGGSWSKVKPEYDAVLNEIFFTPKYLLLYIKASISESFEQLINYKIGSGLFPYLEGSSPYNHIKIYYYFELDTFIKSRQNQGSLNLSFFNQVYLWFMLFVVLLFIFLIMLRKIKLNKVNLILLTSGFLFLILNATITASLANVLARLQSRAIWIFPFIILLIILNQLLESKNNKPN